MKEDSTRTFFDLQSSPVNFSYVVLASHEVCTVLSADITQYISNKYFYFFFFF